MVDCGRGWGGVVPCVALLPLFLSFPASSARHFVSAAVFFLFLFDFTPLAVTTMTRSGA